MPFQHLPLLSDHTKDFAEIERMAGRWEVRAKGRAGAGVNALYSAGIASGLRLEGIRAEGDVVEQILTSPPKGVDTMLLGQVQRYSNVMLRLSSPGGRVELGEPALQWIHGVIEGEEEAGGSYRDAGLMVYRFDRSGAILGESFQALDADVAALKVEEVLQSAEEELSAGECHPLFVVSWLMGQLLVLQPFAEGSQMTAFALGRHLLLKSGYGFVGEWPVEVAFEREVARYHELLLGIRRTLDTDGSGMMEWQGFFLSCLATMARAADDAAKLTDLVNELPPLSDELVKLVKVQGKVTVRDAQASTGANRNTVKAHLRRLVDDGFLARRGVGKGSWYQMSS